MFFSSMNNLIMPGRSENMGDGWETKRRRGPGYDWIILKLGLPGTIRKVEVDTNHFKGNYPDMCSIEGCTAPGASTDELDQNARWTRNSAENQIAGRHAAFLREGNFRSIDNCTHIRLNIYPDGGVSRLRVWGTLRAECIRLESPNEMSDFDLLVRGASRTSELAKEISSRSGKIFPVPRARKSMRQSLTIFPGVIDAHVHFNEPGRTDWEGFDTGSRAAAAGGTTTVFEMPLNAHPPTIDGWSFDLKRAAAERSSFVDFGLWGGLVPGNLDQLETLRDRGVIGLKAFMCDSGIDDFPSVNEQELRAGMQRAADLGLIVAVHAESQEITQQLTQERIAAGKTSVQRLSRIASGSRPNSKRSVRLSISQAKPVVVCTLSM